MAVQKRRGFKSITEKKITFKIELSANRVSDNTG